MTDRVYTLSVMFFFGGKTNEDNKSESLCEDKSGT